MSDKEPNKEDGEALHTLGGAGSTPNVKTVKWDGTEFVKRNGKQKSEDDTFSKIGCKSTSFLQFFQNNVFPVFYPTGNHVFFFTTMSWMCLQYSILEISRYLQLFLQQFMT